MGKTHCEILNNGGVCGGAVRHFGPLKSALSELGPAYQRSHGYRFTQEYARGVKKLQTKNELPVESLVRNLCGGTCAKQF